MRLIPRPSFSSSSAAPLVAATLFATTLAVMAAGLGCAKISKDPGLGTGSGGTSGSGGRGGVISPGSGGAPISTEPVTGSKMGPGFNAGDMGKLDGSPSGAALKIAYPLDGAIFPSNFGPVTVQVPRQQGQDIARIAFTGGNQLDLKYYAVCDTTTVGSGCNITLEAGLTKLFIYPSSTENVTMTVRLSSKSGSNLSESMPISIAWANVPLSGGLYYWTTINPGAVPGYMAPDTTDMRGTAVMRYVFDNDEPKRELVWTDRGSPYTTPPFGESPPAQPGTDPNGLRPAWGEGRCIGCHAISPDGKYMAFSIGGADASSWALLNIASPPTLNELDPTAYPQATAVLDILKRYRKGNFATFTTFGPKSDRMVNMYRGKLTLRGVPDLAVARDDLFAAATSERKSDPFWSPDPEGSFFAFVSYDPSHDMPLQTSRLNGDTKTRGQIWVATADATGPHDDAKLVVPRQDGVTSYYPAISNDARMMVFNRSKCTGPTNPGGYGTNPCDGYDDITATLWLTDPTGSTTPIPLDRANGGEQNSNSWPRWSPDNGLFRGQKLYWLAFSSRRPYGLQINTGSSAASPQLWFAAIMAGDEFTKDPSHAAVWLPKQNLDETNAKPTGNHVPQWVKFAVPIE
jgi:hypothetical protein